MSGDRLPSLPPGEFLCHDVGHTVNMTELSQQDISALFDAMAEELASHGSEFTFVQLRMSAERFVVPLFGLSMERAISTLKPDQYRVYFERKPLHFKQGPVDLVLVPCASSGFKAQPCNGHSSWLKAQNQASSGFDCALF